MTEFDSRHPRMQRAQLSLRLSGQLRLAGAGLCLLVALGACAMSFWFGHSIWSAMTEGVAVSYRLGSGRAVSIHDLSKLYWVLIGTWALACSVSALIGAYLAHAALLMLRRLRDER